MHNNGSIANIDWSNHDGVNLAMINDHTRNHFYDRIIKKNVPGRQVLDIGFGTGLLSILALKYGAEHVTAYESDPDRYVLGTEIISRLNLQDKITLINQRFDHSQYHLYPNHVVVTETVNGNLWQEGIFNSLPRTAGQEFLPGRYFLNIYAVEIPQVFAQGLGVDAVEPRQFTPGVDIDPEFINVVNSYFLSEPANTVAEPLPTLKIVDPHVNTNWGWIPYLRNLNANSCAARYEYNAETVLINDVEPIDFDRRFQTLTVDIRSTDSVLIVPRVGMQHGDNVLFLDQGHWGPTLVPAVVTGHTGTLTVKHDLRNGDIAYELTP